MSESMEKCAQLHFFHLFQNKARIRDTPRALTASWKGRGIEPVKLPPRNPNLNAYAERWIRSVKSECLDHLILFGQRSLAYVLQE